MNGTSAFHEIEFASCRRSYPREAGAAFGRLCRSSPFPGSVHAESPTFGTRRDGCGRIQRGALRSAGSGARWLQDAVDLIEARHWSWTCHAFREWNGWSLEHDGEFWKNGMEPSAEAAIETDRAKVIRRALSKNSRTR